MKRNSRLDAFDADIHDFEYENTQLVRDIVQEGHILFNEKGETIESEDDRNQSEFIHRISALDLPLNHKSDGKINSYENLGYLTLLLQRELNGKRRGKFSDPKIQEEYTDWKERKVEDPETHVYLQEIFLQSVEYLEEYLEIEVPKQLKSHIDLFHRGFAEVLKFLSLSHVNRPNKRLGAFVCALCSIAETIHYTRSKPDELTSLQEKTKDFAEFIIQKGNMGVVSLDDLEQRFSLKSIVPVSFEGGYFKMKSIEFDTKKEHRIWSKLLRIADKDRSDIVKDGIRCRICVDANQKEEVIRWLSSLQFEEKKSSNTTRSAQWDAITYMTGKFQGSNVEVQITDEEMMKRSDWGVLRHEVYEEIQKMLILSRLFGSVSVARMEQKKKDLVHHYAVDEEALEKRMNQFFFKNRDTNRYYSYEYEFRMRGKGIYKSHRFDGLLDYFLTEFYKREDLRSLRSISYETLESIIREKKIPDDLSIDKSQEIYDYMRTKKGVSLSLLKGLELDLEKRKTMIHVRDSVSGIIENHNISLLSSSKKIKAHIESILIDSGMNRTEIEEYLNFFGESWNDRRKVWEDYKKDGLNDMVSAKLFWKTFFWEEQKGFIQTFISDEFVQKKLIDSLESFIDEYIEEMGDSDSFIFFEHKKSTNIKQKKE